MALVFDAIIGNIQEKSMKTFNASNLEVIHYSYLLGSGIILAKVLISGEIITGFEAFLFNPDKSYLMLGGLSISGYLGIRIVLVIVKLFDALTAVTITSLRKALSLCLSFLIYNKPFSYNYLWGGAVVFASVYLNVLLKSKKNVLEPLRQFPKRMFLKENSVKLLPV